MRDEEEEEETDTDMDKKQFEETDDDDDVDDSFDDEEEEEEEEEGAVGRAHSESRLFDKEDDYGFKPRPSGLALEAARKAKSRDDMYDNESFVHSPQGGAKSKSLSSFAQNEGASTSVGNIHLPRRSNLPPPPPTPQRGADNSPYRPDVRPKPMVPHPGLRNMQPPSDSSGRPSPVPRKNTGSSLGPSEQSPGHGNYQRQAGPLPSKVSQ